MTDYKSALDIAVKTAREVGALLRAEFHREGGPRGHGSHADIDREVELVLREALCGAVPWRWLGEETGSFDPPGSDGVHRWVVDPNDGTASFLEGMRGASVSIAALRDGVPVLGVVYAWCWPDDTGELFAWAEGCGPMVHSGRSVTNDLTRSALGAGETVLVSQHADRAPEANARCVSPSRYRPVPSIALRLALVAAGDAVAGVSLASPTTWDLAAGHALLRAVGGVLCDGSGAEVTYGDHGCSASGVVVGGAPRAVEILVKRPWDEVFHEGREGRRAKGILCLGRPSEHVREGAGLERAQGCWLGQLIGDALGAQVEFKSARSIAESFSGGVRDLRDGGTWNTLGGQATDDSELALSLARSLVMYGPDLDRVASAYVAWYTSGPFDCGGTTGRALGAGHHAEVKGQAARVSAAANGASEANGSLMRVSPWAIWFAGRADEAARWASDDSGLTHPNAVCRDACAVYCAAIATAISTGASAAEVYSVALREAQGRSEAVLECLKRAETEAPADYALNMGWVRIALQNAFFQLLHAASFEEALVDTVMHGGDTDTNGAIVGALAGAVWGREAIPRRWQRAVLSCRPLRSAGAAKPRPMEYWPADALALAEELLFRGRRESGAG